MEQVLKVYTDLSIPTQFVVIIVVGLVAITLFNNVGGIFKKLLTADRALPMVLGVATSAAIIVALSVTGDGECLIGLLGLAAVILICEIAHYYVWDRKNQMDVRDQIREEQERQREENTRAQREHELKLQNKQG